MRRGFGWIHYTSAAGLLTQPGVKGADKYQYEETAEAARRADGTEREETD